MSASRIFNGKRVDERNEFITLREGELSVDLCNLSIYVHDGHTPGGRQVGTGAAGQNGVSITGALVNDAGHLILTKSDSTTIDAGSVVGPSGTGTNFLSTGTGTVIVGFGLQTNPDGTISVNSATIQSLLPILEINPHGQATTQITNNLWVQGLISASSLTVTNAIIFGDGTVMTSTNSVNIQTIAVSNIDGSTINNEVNEVSALRFDTAGFTITDMGSGVARVTAISSGTGTTNIIQSSTAPAGNETALWYDTVGGRSYVYYDSGWVDASPMPAIDTTQLTNNGYSLVLGSDGNLTLPNSSTFDGQTLTDHSSSTNYTLKIANGGGAGSVFGIGTGDATFGIANDSLNHAENGYVPYTVTAQRINFTVPGSGTWAFGDNGSLTWPNSSVQTGASISIAELKTIITTCTNFTEFKNAILGL
jgi:hypothetical protein